MGRHIQTFKLNFTDTVVEGDTQSLGALGRVFGHIAGDLLGAQLPLVAGLGDVAHVELLTPAGSQRHALVLLLDHRAGHGHRGGGPPHGGLEEVGREPARWRHHTGRAGAVGGGVQADDGVEVDRAALLVLGHLGKGDPHQPRSWVSELPTSWARARYR
jgi:hypothetical protein